MKLRFLPRGDAMPFEPYAPMATGQPARRIGRKFNPETKAYDLSKPYECEDGTREAARCRKFLIRGDVVPADKATADALGVPFATVEPAQQEPADKKKKGNS